MMTAFRGLRLQLNKCIDVDSAVHISRMLGLTTDEVSEIRHNRDPANLLWDILLNKSIISITHVSLLESALVENDNHEAATLVQEFRRNNIYTHSPSY